MNQEAFLEKIKIIEDTFPVNDSKYRSVHTWPVIRYILLLRFKQGFTEPGNSFVPVAPPRNFKDNLLQIYIGLRHYLKYKKSFRAIIPQLGTAKVIMFGRNVEYTDLVDSKKYNRLIDPFIDYFKSKKIPVVKIEVGKPESVAKFYESVLIDDTDFGIFYRSGRFFRNEKGKDDRLILLLNEVEKHTGINIRPDEVYKLIENSFYYKELFKKVLEKHKPKAVFLSAYYDKDTFGLILACRDLNIRTVDIQHGKQGEFHFMYSHWTKIPLEGYSLLPDYFWNWGRESKENIARWMRPESPHKAVVGGNLWMMRWKNNKIPDAHSHLDFFNRLKNYKRIVLFSLQPIGTANFPDFVLKAILIRFILKI